MNGSFGVEKSPHLLMAFTISKLKWLYHINSGTTKVYSSPRRAMGGDKTAVAVCLCNSATYERGSLNGARRAGLCLIFEGCCCLNKPPCVPCNTICLARNVGRGSTPSQLSYRFGAAFFFFFSPPFFFSPSPPPRSCNRLLCRGRLQKADLLPWASRVVGCIIINIIRFFKIFFFFLSKFKVTGLFVLVAKRSAAFDYIFMPLLTFNFPSPLRRAPGENMARKVAEVFPAALWFQKPLPAAAHAEDAVSSAW